MLIQLMIALKLTQFFFIYTILHWIRIHRIGIVIALHAFDFDALFNITNYTVNIELDMIPYILY